MYFYTEIIGRNIIIINILSYNITYSLYAIDYNIMFLV